MRLFLKVPKTCHVAILKPNRNSLQGLSRVVLGCQSLGSEFSKAAAEVFETLKLLKVPKPCHVAVSKQQKQLAERTWMPRPRFGAFERAAAEGFELLRLLKGA